MRIMLTGATGQVGWELARSLMPLGQVVVLTRSQCDLSQPQTLSGIVQEIKPDVIVNAAAYTAVDKAEEEEALATTINGTAVGVLAEEAKKLNALLIHYSTDYVFDGNKPIPYLEEDIPNPINAYGRSKLAGEKALSQVGCDYLIFRTSWVYAAHGNNFVKTMLRLARERDELKVVADQFGAPTCAELIADITALALYKINNNPHLEDALTGTYHLTAAGKTNWHSFCQFILETAIEFDYKLRISSEGVIPLTTAEYPMSAKRPINSLLDTSKLNNIFGIVAPFWEPHATRMIREVTQWKQL